MKHRCMPIDLVLLVADKNIEYGMRGLLGRPEALGIRPIQFKIYVHPQHDPGCVARAQEFLRPFSSDYNHALVVFDHQGCGREELTPPHIADALRGRLTGGTREQRQLSLHQNLRRGYSRHLPTWKSASDGTSL